MACWRKLRFSGLPERVAGVPLELGGNRALALAPRLVPDLAADLIEGVVASATTWKGSTQRRAWGAALGDRPRDPARDVAGDELKAPAALLAETIEERLTVFISPPGSRPEGWARVVVDDHGQVALALAMADLIDPDPPQAGRGGRDRGPPRQRPARMRPTVRQLTRISSATALFDVFTASQAS